MVTPRSMIICTYLPLRGKLGGKSEKPKFSNKKNEKLGPGKARKIQNHGQENII